MNLKLDCTPIKLAICNCMIVKSMLDGDRSIASHLLCNLIHSCGVFGVQGEVLDEEWVVTEGYCIHGPEIFSLARVQHRRGFATEA